MGDQANDADDISALWGQGVFEPAPVGRTEQGAGRTNGADDGESRLVAIEAHLGALTKAVDALRGEVRVQIDLGVAGADRRATEATGLLATRLADLGQDLEERLGRVTTLLGSRQPAGDIADQFAREVLAVRVAAAQDTAQRVAELDARLHDRLDELAARVPGAGASERLGALECRTAPLAEAIAADRREAGREPHREVATTVDAMLAEFRTELRAELAAELRSALRAELAAQAGAGTGANREAEAEAAAEAQRRRLEASSQQPMPGL